MPYWQLVRLYQGRVEHDYALNSRVVCAIFNFAGMGKRKPSKPDDFNPFRKKSAGAVWTKEAARAEAKRVGFTTISKDAIKVIKP